MKILVCGTRKKIKGYTELVKNQLDSIEKYYAPDIKIDCIIEGCCPDSADIYAEEWAKEHNIEIKHFPANSGNYLKRNLEMIKECDRVIAFWDGWSYGTAFTIAHALNQLKKPLIVMLNV